MLNKRRFLVAFVATFASVALAACIMGDPAPQSNKRVAFRSHHGQPQLLVFACRETLLRSITVRDGSSGDELWQQSIDERFAGLRVIDLDGGSPFPSLERGRSIMFDPMREFSYTRQPPRQIDLSDGTYASGQVVAIEGELMTVEEFERVAADSC